MNMIQRAASLGRGVLEGVKRMFGRSAAQGVEALRESVITDDMAAAIDRWVALYQGRAPWLDKNRLSLGAAAAVAREIATLVTLEAKVEVTGGDAAGDDLSARARLLRDCLAPLLGQLSIQTEYACAFGGVVFRPYIDGDRVAVDCVNADNFYPISFNARGEITGAVFIERKRQGRDTFLRVEKQQLQGDGSYIIQNTAYRTYQNGAIGTRMDLTEVPEWAQIQPEIELKNIREPLFAYFKIPHGNVIDIDSPLGVSVYARADASGLLEEIDKQFQRLSWEYEGGELAIDAAVSAFKREKDGKVILPSGKERLYRLNNLGIMEGSGEDRFRLFAPNLRDNSYTGGLNQLLMRLEDLCGIARGTLSDANEAARTATELRITKQRTYATVTSIQMSLQAALERLARAMDALITLYHLAPPGPWELSFVWDDSVIVDAQVERDCDRQDVLDGIMQSWEYRVKWYGESESAARAATEGARTPADSALADAPVSEEE